MEYKLVFDITIRNFQYKITIYICIRLKPKAYAYGAINNIVNSIRSSLDWV